MSTGHLHIGDARVTCQWSSQLTLPIPTTLNPTLIELLRPRLLHDAAALTASGTLDLVNVAHAEMVMRIRNAVAALEPFGDSREAIEACGCLGRGRKSEARPGREVRLLESGRGKTPDNLQTEPFESSLPPFLVIPPLPLLGQSAWIDNELAVSRGSERTTTRATAREPVRRARRRPTPASSSVLPLQLPRPSSSGLAYRTTRKSAPLPSSVPRPIRPTSRARN
jgi:hypothetical protein